MTPTATVMTDCSKYLESLTGSCWAKFCHANPFVASHWRAEADFKILQLLFEAEFHMPVHFDYVSYMKLVMQDTVRLLTARFCPR